MKFHTYIDVIRQRVNVYCEVNGDGTADHTRVFLTRGGPMSEGPTEVHHVAMGQEPPLWDWFPLQVVDALGEALAPRPVASERHLTDAIQTRDRILSMLDRTLQPPFITLHDKERTP